MKRQEDESIDLEGLIKELELKLERLKVVYEQYFMGIERREPLVLKKDVVRLMRTLDQVKIRNTGLKFRLRMIVQRFNSYKTYWGRTLRAIDNGTYHRDVARVSRKFARQGITLPPKGKMRTAAEVERAITQALSQAEAGESDGGAGASASDPSAAAVAAKGPSASAAAGAVSETHGDRASRAKPAEPESLAPINIDQLEEPSTPAAQAPTPAAQAKARASQPPRSSAPPRPYPSTDPLSAEQMKSIYRRFIKAKQMCGEDTSKVKYDSLVQSISKQMPTIRKRYSGKDVDFQVVIRSGRAILKAMVKD